MFKMLKRNKTGISPLIATVLLVTFVVILSAIILFWGKEYVTELMEKRGDVAAMKLECQDVEIEVIGIEAGRLNIRNNSPFPLYGFILKYSEIGTMSVNKPIASYENIYIELTSQIGTVDAIPVLRPPGIGAPTIPCSNKHKLINL